MPLRQRQEIQAMLWVTIPIRKLFVDEGQEDRLVFKHMIEHKDVNAVIVFELTRIIERLRDAKARQSCRHSCNSDRAKVTQAVA